MKKKSIACGSSCSRSMRRCTLTFAASSLKKYGKEVVPPNGPIPAQLLGNIWSQEWNNVCRSDGLAKVSAELRPHQNSAGPQNRRPRHGQIR